MVLAGERTPTLSGFGPGVPEDEGLHGDSSYLEDLTGGLLNVLRPWGLMSSSSLS